MPKKNNKTKFTKVVLPSKNLNTARVLNWYKPVAKYFDKPQARPWQKEIIGIVKDGIEDRGFKYIFLQLPTGDGKSVDAVTVGEYLRQEKKRSYYLLSMDLGLTAQYRRDYPFLKEVKGRNNFMCNRYPGMTADKAPCVFRGANSCPMYDECAYIRQREAAVMSYSTLSTPYYIDRCTPGEIFSKRFLAIRDEAHKLEKFYMGMFDVRITDGMWNHLNPYQSFPLYDDIDFWVNEVDDMHGRLDSEVEDAFQENDIKTLERIVPWFQRLEDLKVLFKAPGNVVVDVDKTPEQQRLYATFRPVTVDKIARKHIDKVADHTIFMSATFLDVKERCSHLGLNIDDVLYVNKIESNFPKKNRHIIYNPVGSMSWKHRDKTMPKMLDAILGIIKERNNVVGRLAPRGLIICASHVIRKQVADYLKIKYEHELIITHTGESGSFNTAFERFLDRPTSPLIFVTTRYEGLDFHGKLAEYMIYVNLPYMPPMDKQVKARMKLDQVNFLATADGCGYTPNEHDDQCAKSAYCNGCKRWYNLYVAEAIQQAVGRIIRTPEDVGYIYILDSRFKRFFNDNNDMFLKYNRDAIEGLL